MNSKPLALCVDRFKAEKTVEAVWLIGSASREALRRDSDIDFAIYLGEDKDLNWELFGSLIADLENIVGRRVDIGKINSKNLIYASQVIHQGKLLWARDDERINEVIGRMITLYVDLKQDRKVVEDAYCAR